MLCAIVLSSGIAAFQILETLRAQRRSIRAHLTYDLFAFDSYRLGVAMNGVVLVSPFLDPGASIDRELSPLPWMLTLPTIVAANLERQGKLTDAKMGEVIEF